MRLHPVYLLYGLSLIGLAGSSGYFGWSASNTREIRGVPKSIRDNPGAYRAIYAGYPRYSGGK